MIKIGTKVVLTVQRLRQFVCKQQQASFGCGVGDKGITGMQAQFIHVSRIQPLQETVGFARDVDDAATYRGRADQVKQQVRQKKRTYTK